MILKTLFKISMLLVIIVAGLSYVTYLRTGQSMASLLKKAGVYSNNTSLPTSSLKQMPEAIGNKLNQVMHDLADQGSGQKAQQHKVAYKWLDTEGKWQYSNEKPPAGTAFQEIKALP